MKSLKKLIASALVFAIVLTFCACDFGPKQYEASDLSYFEFTEIAEGYAVSAKNVNNLPEKLNIPEFYEDKPVIKIDDNGFVGAQIKDLAIPSSVKYIGSHAFENSTLESIYFFTGVQIIWDAAFYGCKSLKTLNLPRSLMSLGQSAFASCTSISAVVLPEKLIAVNNACFAYCLALERVYIPRTVSIIGESVFVGCSGNIEFEISASNEHYKLDANGYPVAR